MDVKAKIHALNEEESQALDELLDANGYSRDDLLAGPQITHLEMFLHEYPKMLSLHLFPFLESLCLIHQEIKEIAPLDQCVNLERLWIVENEVKVIKGLSKLTKLRELYLYSNRISKMEGLQHLTNLEVLWLSDNYISTISDLGTLTRLRDLNLARNDIAVIGDSLLANTALETLNLADNAIGSFKEVRPLTRLPYLTDLCFADPMWGDCPISALCNYQTYVLFMLPKLASLDTLLLADETKQLAEATFLKKQMYYNMRIKTMHRNARNIIKLATEGKKVRSQYNRPAIARLVQHQKELQRELGEAHAYGQDMPAPDGGPRPSGAAAGALQQKADQAQALLDEHNQQTGEMDVEFDECTSRTYQVVDAYVGRMMLELETAGNIRLEEGRPTDLWYTSCVDLLMSRFNASDYDNKLGVTGLNVLSVTRVHNRWLRNRFDKQLSGCIDTQDGSYKKAMEYLFLGEHPALPGDMDGVVESGIMPTSASTAMGLDSAVVLSNSVLLADQLRLQAVLEARHHPAAKQGGGATAVDKFAKVDNPAVGRLLIVKAYLGRTAADSHTASNGRLSGSGPKLFGPDGQLLVASCLEGPKVERRTHAATAAATGAAPVDAVYRCRPGDTKQRLWYMFDHTLVLPEYLVEFQYQLSPSSAKLQPRTPHALGPASSALSHDMVSTIINGLEPELRPLARPLMNWLAFHFDPSLMQQLDQGHEVESKVAALISAGPQPSSRPKLHTMTLENLGKHLQGLPMGSLTYLNLHNCALRKIENLTLMKQLQTLVLSFNDITRLESLGELGALSHLDVAHNLVKKVDGLKGLTRLQHLDMSCNQVAKLEEIYGLKKYVSQLTYLDLSGNALCEDKSYRPTVLRKMTALCTLDGRRISPAEQAMFGDNAGALTLALVMEHGTAGMRYNVGEGGPALGGSVQPANIQELVIERKHIRRVQNLQSLVNLRRASFADNQISHIEGLEACTALEELCMEDNRIGSIEGLAGLTRLKKLQLGRNRLAALDMLSHVTNLTQLSVEDNELSSLAGLEPLVCLMELYAGNNRIHELREVQRLRELPKIIILDLSGNPCTASAADDYRLYVIFNVRKLKVLDGTPIDAAEQAAANAKYAGRLTLDFLEEKLGHRMFDRIRDLDVSGIKVRDVGGVFLRDELESLQELNLSNNMLVEVSGLALLRQLVVLKLNNNRLGEECTFNPRRMLEKNADLYKAWSDPTRQQRHVTSGSASPSGGIDLFPCLQTLQLGSNQIASISSLQLGCLTSLRTLFLNNNDITRIDGLEGLVNLQELVLDRNRIRYIDPEAFAGLGRLRELRLEDNGLRSLVNLHHLTSLQSLHLSYNRISEPLELDRLSGLNTLVEVNLVNNPITRKQGYRSLLICKCPKLYTADGQVITFEEREYADGMLSSSSMQTAAHVVGADGMGLGLAGKQGQAVRLTNLDFASLAAAASQFGQVPVGMVPSISSGMIMLGSTGLGLEGISLRDGLGGGGGAGGKDAGMGLGGGVQGIQQGMDQVGRDAWGRPTSNDRRAPGGAAGGVGAAGGPRTIGAARIAGPDGAGMGGAAGVAVNRGAAGASASPARRQALLGRQPGGYNRGYNA